MDSLTSKHHSSFQNLKKKKKIEKPHTDFFPDLNYSLLPENIRKPKSFLMFSGGIDKQHWTVMNYITFY